MIERKTRWFVAPWSELQEVRAAQLCTELGLSPLASRLLVQRGITDAASAHAFLHGGEECLHDPYMLAGMKEAVERIRQARDRNEKVRIYGDYDADGVSSTTLLVYLFRKLGLHFDYYIPHRALEGYGMNRQAIQLASEEGVSLIVTVDTGISAYEEVAYAKELGIDVVVTDHHEPPELLPEACAVVNPKQEHCPYPFKGLAGVGVAFKLASALLDRPPLEWADIVSLGTVADLMPLTDENRIFVRYGLERLRTSAGTGFRALAEVAGIELEKAVSTNIAFGMAPRINAAGRLDHAKKAVELLIADHYDDAITAAASLDSLNKERQRIVEAMTAEAELQWLGKCAEAEKHGAEAPSVIVLAEEGWNVGVIGIVASKLLEKNYKPVIILGIDAETGMCKGSARSIDGFDLHAALTECEQLLDHYGGHQAAAGMSLHRSKLEAFEQKLCELAGDWLTEDDWIPKTTIDLVCALADASLTTISELSQLEPFGVGNPSPKLLFEAVELADKRVLGKDARHLKLALGSKRGQLDAIGFGMGPYADKLQLGKRIEVIGELSINEWNGMRKPQLQLYDLHAMPRSLKRFPEREQFGHLYQQMRKIGQAPLQGLADELSKRCDCDTDTAAFMLDVFEELQFIYRHNGRMVAAASPAKRDLSTSAYYQAMKRQFDLNESALAKG